MLATGPAAKGFPLVVEICEEAFLVIRAILAVPRADHVSHMEVAPHTFDDVRSGREYSGGKYITGFSRSDLPSLDSTPHLLIWTMSIPTLLPLLFGQAPPYEEGLNWLQFSYTRDRTGVYMDPISTEIVFSVLA